MDRYVWKYKHSRNLCYLPGLGSVMQKHLLRTSLMLSTVDSTVKLNSGQTVSSGLLMDANLQVKKCINCTTSLESEAFTYERWEHSLRLWMNMSLCVCDGGDGYYSCLLMSMPKWTHCMLQVMDMLIFCASLKTVTLMKNSSTPVVNTHLPQSVVYDLLTWIK